MGQQRRQARKVRPRPPEPKPGLDLAGGQPAGADDDAARVTVGQWTGALACALWTATRDNIHDFAGWLGVGSSTVEAWKDHPGIVPTPTNQRVLDEALRQLDDEAKRRFALLTTGERLVRVSDSLWLDWNGDNANRAQFFKLAGASLGAAAAQLPLDVLERIAAQMGRADRVDHRLVTSYDAVADALASQHRGCRPDVLLDQVADHADGVLGLLGRHMASPQRRRLDVVAVESRVQAGMLAFLAGDRTAALRHFALAQKVADDAGDGTLRAWAWGASSVLCSPIPTGGVGGDPDRAVKLLRRAVEHARRSDEPTRGWAHRWLALELAAGHDERGFREHMAQAERLCWPGSRGRGYPARSLLGGPDLRDLGVGLVLIGRADEAVEALAAAPASPEWPVRQVAVLVDLAGARVLQREPEQVCDELTRALGTAVDIGYVTGVERIRGVRASFDESWAVLSCTRDLDELLRPPV